MARELAVRDLRKTKVDVPPLGQQRRRFLYRLARRGRRYPVGRQVAGWVSVYPDGVLVPGRSPSLRWRRDAAPDRCPAGTPPHVGPMTRARTAAAVKIVIRRRHPKPPRRNPTAAGRPRPPSLAARIPPLPPPQPARGRLRPGASTRRTRASSSTRLPKPRIGSSHSRIGPSRLTDARKVEATVEMKGSTPVACMVPIWRMPRPSLSSHRLPSRLSMTSTTSVSTEYPRPSKESRSARLPPRSWARTCAR